LDIFRRHELFPNQIILNEIIPNVKILNPENSENPECKNPENTAAG
jgi:hypothetical protein